MFVPRLYINIGAKNHYFTLRESYLHHYHNGDGMPCVEVRLSHLFNLSQNAQEALAKAQEYAEQVGLELCASHDSLEQEMAAIKRASAEELAERERAEAQRLLEAEERRKAYEAEQLEKAVAGYVPFGKFKGWSVAELRDSYMEGGRQYLVWIANSDIESPVFEALRVKIKELAPVLFLPKADPAKKYGEAGQQVEVEVHVVKKAWYRSQWGIINIVSMVAEDGSMLVSKGAFNGEAGDKMRIKGRIKEHAEYQGQMQSVIQRIKIIQQY